MRYRTIVADPPWPMGKFGNFAGYDGPRRVEDRSGLGTSDMPYRTMAVPEIAALPVDDLAAEAAHLYLWATDRFLDAAHDVLRAWGFRKSQTLVWAKEPRGLGPGGAFATTTEFVLMGARGGLRWKGRMDSTWFAWKRHYEGGYPVHSAKPDGFIDLVEQMSPGPYLELFARRARFGWDYWGDESLQTAEMPA